MSVRVSLKEDVFNVKYFPKLMKDHSGMLVLFSRASVGTVLFTVHNYTMGDRVEGFDMKYFKDYNEEVTLKNE